MEALIAKTREGSFEICDGSGKGRNVVTATLGTQKREGPRLCGVCETLNGDSRV